MAGLRHRPGAAATGAPRDEAPTPDLVDEQVDEQPDLVEDGLENGLVTGVLGEAEPEPAEAEDDTEPEDDDAESEDTVTEDEDEEDEPKPTSRLERRRAARDTKTAKGTKDAKSAKPANKSTAKTATPTAPKGARPTGKRRAGGTTRPDSLAKAERGAATSKHAKQRDLRVAALLSNRINVAILLAVIAVVLGGLAYWFRSEANDLSSGQGNNALSDVEGTSAAVSQLTAVVEDTFSYNYTDLDKTKNAVAAGITGKASCEYNKLFKVVLDNAPTQQLILTTEVRKLSIERLEGDGVRALAFIDQTTTKVGAANAVAGGGGMLGISAQRVGDHWKITEFDTFNNQLPNGQPAPTC